jgi:glycosyltransferase involved in cell wall biosynthesis
MPEETAGGRVAYVMKGYPRLSEVFITSEVYRVERLGVPLRLYVIKAADEEVHHDVVRRVRTQPEYLLQPSSLTRARLHRWVVANLGLFRPALLRTARRHPVGLARAAGQALGQAVRARRSTWSAPRKLYLLELLRAVDLADRLDRAGDVDRLHAHFAHGTTTVTWLASTVTGIPFSFTGHAKDIYTEELNPAGLLRRKMDAATLVVTCTEANQRHLASLGSTTPVHVVYHGLNADFESLVASGVQRTAPARVRLLAVGRLVRKKGLDTFVDACAVLSNRGLDFEAVIAGEAGDHEPEVRARVAAAGLDARITFLGPLTQDALFGEYQRASVFALPCRVLEDGDRDGIPNVLMEAMACGVPVVTTGVSGITELVRDGENGLIVEPDRPAELADALHRLLKDPGLAQQLAAQGQVTVSERFDAAVTASRMAALLTGGGAR